MINMDTLTQEYNKLAKSFLKKRIADGGNENIVFSPLSVYTLLAIAADATAGQTRRELSSILCRDEEFEIMLRTLKSVLDTMTSSNSISAANAVAVCSDIKDSITPGYVEHLREIFRGELFTAENMKSAINTWVRKQTKGMIQEIADDSIKNMLLCLMNACTFDADWKTEYKKQQVRNGDFNNSDGTVSRVKMLSSIEQTYIENDQFIGFSKPYKGNQFSFMALLPKKGLFVSEEMLNAIDFSSVMSGKENTRADVLMPEFKCSSDFDITKFCKASGIKTLFTPEADFSPMSGEWIKAKAIRHKAHIEVDRRGTKAAAVIAMYGLAGGFPSDLPEFREVILDRPFLYAVMHNETKLPVFIGIVNRLNPIGDKGMYLTDQEKEAFCKPIYDRICSMILDEDGIVKENVDRTFWHQVYCANVEFDADKLQKLEEEIKRRIQ